MNEKPINCTVKHAISISPSIRQGTEGESFKSGCKIIDIYFASISNPEIGAIQFQNSYVAFLTVKVKLKGADQLNKIETNDQEWKTAVSRLKLMPDCHAEMGSQDIFTLTRKQFAFDLSNVVSLRLILQQPSPVWKDFDLLKLKLFPSFPGPKPVNYQNWFTEAGENKNMKRMIEFNEPLMDLAVKAENQNGGAPDLNTMSIALQQLWALTEEASCNQTEESLGRYEVDGCYDINLLSYT